MPLHAPRRASFTVLFPRQISRTGADERQWRTVMLSLSDLDVGITMGEFLMGCFFVAVVWRLFVGSGDRGADALRRDGGRRLY